MKLYQVVSSLNFGDAIGNDVIAIKHVIEDMGIETAIYASSVSPKITEPDVYLFENMPKLSNDDIILYHMGSGEPVNELVAKLNCRKIMRYHNITPPEFFSLDNPVLSEVCRKGLSDMRKVMKGNFTAHIAVSEFNKSNMIEMGYRADSIEVIPIIFPFDDYRNTAPDEAMVKRFSDGAKNIVFVGRIAPNKKHEDIIRCFAYYQRHVDPNARLILVGSSNPSGIYYGDICEYIKTLGVQNVIFPGHISFAEILAIYKTADVFLCMSEHEGFCVPILEAMTFDVPIIAYDSCAVPETMGGSGVVVDTKDPAYIARVISEVVNNETLRTKIIEAQRERLKRFDYEVIKKELQDYIRRFMDKYPPISPDSGTDSYHKLYDQVNDVMKSSGGALDFTQEALIAQAERSAETIDITAIINKNLPVRELVETVFVSLLDRLPDAESRTKWEREAETCTMDELVKRLITSVTGSDEFRATGNRTSYDPFTPEGGAAC